MSAIAAKVNDASRNEIMAAARAGMIAPLMFDAGRKCRNLKIAVERPAIGPDWDRMKLFAARAPVIMPVLVFHELHGLIRQRENLRCSAAKIFGVSRKVVIPQRQIIVGAGARINVYERIPRMLIRKLRR